MPVPDPNPPAGPPVSLDGRYEEYAYLLDDETLDRLPRIKRTRERPLNDREVLDLPDTDPRRRREAGLVEMRAQRDDARRQLVEQGQAAEEQADALRSEVARLSGLLDDEVGRRARAELNLAAQQQTTVTLREQLDGERARAERAEGLVDDPSELPPLDGDPRRPRLDHFPEDAILLRYRELRRLLALHLDRYGASPEVVRAVREGDVPLRLAEVLDR